jgi:catechol 2,3-dioxygenase-like lactoylglutathione lyase family enzyme
MSSKPTKGVQIESIQLVCRDVAAMTAFYQAAFDCISSSPERLMLGSQSIELIATKPELPIFAPANSTAFQHFAIVVSDMHNAVLKLSACQGWFPISRGGPQVLPGASGGVTAFKFRDPDGHPLELLQFPDAAPSPVWSERPGLFLGIDHSAITVANTARSVAFYKGLGFLILGMQINRGSEQERLDDLDAAVVEVTGLASSTRAAPHLELLCYQTPGVIDEVAAADDLRSTRLVLKGGDRANLLRAVQAERLAANNSEMCIRDPDGHVLGFD